MLLLRLGRTKRRLRRASVSCLRGRMEWKKKNERTLSFSLVRFLLSFFPSFFEILFWQQEHLVVSSFLVEDAFHFARGEGCDWELLFLLV